MAKVNAFLEDESSSDSSDDDSDGSDGLDKNKKGKEKAVMRQSRDLPAATGPRRPARPEGPVPSAVGDGACKERQHVDRSSDQPPPKKKHKEHEGSTVPMARENAWETSMSRCTMVHPKTLFVGKDKAYGGGTPLKVNTAPMLAVVDLTREAHLFHRTDSSSRSLRVVLESIVDSLHPQGTMALALPRPWHTMRALVGGALTSIDDAVVEDSTIAVTYEDVLEDPLKEGQENHLRKQTELVLLVHRPCPPDKPFTCNRRVVPSDVFGRSTGKYPLCENILTVGPSPAGAPNGGSCRIFPEKAARFLIGRFTNAQDTVLGIGVEATTVAEVAIGLGRCVEFHLTEEDERAVLQKSIADAFCTAHSRGMFQSRLGQEAGVGPKLLPSGLPRSTAPPGVTLLLAAKQEEIEGDGPSQRLEVAPETDKKSKNGLKGGHDRANAELRPKKNRNGDETKDEKKSKRGKMSQLDDTTVWGEVVVKTPLDEADPLA